MRVGMIFLWLRAARQDPPRRQGLPGLCGHYRRGAGRLGHVARSYL
jgi:hypothetical protein